MKTPRWQEQLRLDLLRRGRENDGDDGIFFI